MRILDLFCGAGGAAMGYHRAGFEVVGVDLSPQPHFPFEFHQADALEYLAEHGSEFAAIHASPPCQAYSFAATQWRDQGKQYPDLVVPTRGLLNLSDRPWVMENVPGSPLRADLTLCGQMFGLELYRHRLFELSFTMAQPEHPEHILPAMKMGRWEPGYVISVAGHIAPVAQAKKAMGIDWMPRQQLVQAIPPAYTEYVGKHLMEHLTQGRKGTGR